MQLPRDGREYAHIGVGALPAGATLEASIDRATWTPVAVTPLGTPVELADGSQITGEAKYLVRGPDFPADGLGGALITGHTKVWIRVVDTPEVLPRQAGSISLY